MFQVIPDALFAHERLVRLGAFGGVFVVMAIWELVSPRRPQTIGRTRRWPNNLGVVVAGHARRAHPVPDRLPSALALVAEAQGWGLFNALALPAGSTITASVILLDLAIYLQHVMFHAVPALWRLHRMHHADLDIRRDHRRALPSDRDRALDADQVRGRSSCSVRRRWRC